MVSYIVFKAVLIGVLLGGLIFAIASMKNAPTQGSPSVNFDNQGRAINTIVPNKTISAIQTFVKFIAGCLVMALVIAVPFMILRFVL